MINIASDYKIHNDYESSRPNTKPDVTKIAREEPTYDKQFKMVLHKVIKRSLDEMDYLDWEMDVLYPTTGTTYVKPVMNGKSNEDGVGVTFKSECSRVHALENIDFSSPMRQRRELTNVGGENGDGTSQKRLIPFNPYLRVADLKYITHLGNHGTHNVLIVAGTTNGYGKAFGIIHDINDGNQQHNSNNHHTFHHGFVTRININDGSVVATSSIQAGPGSWVSIKGICYGNTKSFMNEYLYVVGETNGHLDQSMSGQDISLDVNTLCNAKHAFLSKLNFEMLEVVWMRQIGTMNGNNVVGNSCAVSIAEDMVFMVGTVQNAYSLKVLHKDVNDAGIDHI